MIFQDPYSSLNPRKTVGSIIADPFVIHGLLKDRGRAQAPGAGADGSRGAEPRALQPLPARVLRRSAPADRRGAGDRPGAEAARGRRAGLGARRLDPGPGAQPAARAPAGDGADARLHRPRPVGRAPHVRPGDGDVPRLAGRGRAAATTCTPSPATRTPARCCPPCRWPMPQAGRRTRALLSGDVPSPANPPPACRFHTRCPKAQAVCSRARRRRSRSRTRLGPTRSPPATSRSAARRPPSGCRPRSPDGERAAWGRRSVRRAAGTARRWPALDHGTWDPAGSPAPRPAPAADFFAAGGPSTRARGRGRDAGRLRPARPGQPPGQPRPHPGGPRPGVRAGTGAGAASAGRCSWRRSSRAAADGARRVRLRALATNPAALQLYALGRLQRVALLAEEFLDRRPLRRRRRARATRSRRHPRRRATRSASSSPRRPHSFTSRKSPR